MRQSDEHERTQPNPWPLDIDLTHIDFETLQITVHAGGWSAATIDDCLHQPTNPAL